MSFEIWLGDVVKFHTLISEMWNWRWADRLEMEVEASKEVTGESMSEEEAGWGVGFPVKESWHRKVSSILECGGGRW